MKFKNYNWAILALILCVVSCDEKEQVTDITQFPRIKIENQSIKENGGGSGVEVLLTWAYEQPVTVDYTTENLDNGIAQAGVDFVGETGTITFQPGELVQSIPVNIIDDIFTESDEKFQITLSNPVLGRLLNTTAIITIEDEDEELTIDGSGYEAPEVYQGFQRVWEDDFSGNEIDTDVWGYNIGGDGWGNQELQYYTDSPTNSFQTQGYLFIEAKEEQIGNNNYTSARLLSKDKFDTRYGRVDIRARLPKGQGLWPALWMLGSNFDTVGWPRCGEIDIMELIGSQPNLVHGTCHYLADSGVNDKNGGNKLLTGGGDFSDEFHVFSIVWREDYIEWRMDGQKFHSVTPDDINGDWPYNNDFFFILNVAVGGEWPGSPDASTVFPQQMLIDYIRLYKLV